MTNLIEEADQKNENHGRATNSSDVCYKGDQSFHSIRDCPMYKADNWEYVNFDKVKTHIWTMFMTNQE